MVESLGVLPWLSQRLTRPYVFADGAGHSGHDLIHLMSWFNHDPIDPNILANIKVPVLILAGELDEVSRPRLGVATRHIRLTIALAFRVVSSRH